MKTFRCDHCRQLVFFENVLCERCGHALAYLPELGVVGSLDPADGPGLWTSPLPRAAGRQFRLCANYVNLGACNWALGPAEAGSLCRSCTLTTDIPNLSRPADRSLWVRLEAAKRRLVYTLDALGLTLAGLSFKFLADVEGPDAKPVLTGHDNGVITINIAEADDAERERRRTALGEPYRTMVGHMRHESGHFYFDQLVVPDAARLGRFRALFGDERADYGEALKRHYAAGPPGDWPFRCVSAYAAAHPWEDWAETWAHYLHMVDTLETAAASGISLAPPHEDRPESEPVPDPVAGRAAFDEMMDGWLPLTYVLNNLNRGLGLPDAYPFVLSAPAVEKLRFVHDAVTRPG
ncbi:MAG: zinc-binding metallopeptidase family protein [Gemmataceae bacterium]